MPAGGPPAPSLNRQVLSLAVPALGALVAEPLFVLIDSAMVGHLGEASLAGLSLASSLLTTVVGLFVFLAYATTATTARRFGAGDRVGGLRAGVDGAWLAALLGLTAAGLLVVGAPSVVKLMGADGAVAAAAVVYLRASAPGLPGMLVVYAATGTLRGLLNTRTPFVVAAVGAVGNVALNAALLYGVGMGIAGSGLGTAIAQTTMAVALLSPVVKAARAAGVPTSPRAAGLRASLGTGAPLLVRTVSLRAAILATVWSATALGPTALAAHQVVNALWNFTAFALDALAIAAQALVGTALGRADAERAAQVPADQASAPTNTDSLRAGRDPAEHPATSAVSPQASAVPTLPHGGPTVDAVLQRCLAWGVAAGAVIGVLLAAGSPWLPHLFTSAEAVVGAARPALLVAAAAMPLAGAVFLFDGVLMGAGDGRYLAWAQMATLVPYLPLAVIVAQGRPAGGTAGLVWLWVAFAWVFMGARALVTGLRARSDAWRH
ncbi:MATE family efflux transporter [Actinomyces sp.]|uniref:MATE family efflux transporter n=1 Tax=Actinomyces sp. TaxID=29317 RepID=UPI0026DCB484|nr:MATE family efflux transporter [Actinomyces sp.]MDO4900202.1 MATE family efflux transporter [Actinomyces sp.]